MQWALVVTVAVPVWYKRPDPARYSLSLWRCVSLARYKISNQVCLIWPNMTLCACSIVTQFTVKYIIVWISLVKRFMECNSPLYYSIHPHHEEALYLPEIKLLINYHIHDFYISKRSTKRYTKSVTSIFVELVLRDIYFMAVSLLTVSCTCNEWGQMRPSLIYVCCI